MTGGRIKIGYHVTLKLLRAGATVVVTTRFPNNAAARFAKVGVDFQIVCTDRAKLSSPSNRTLPLRPPNKQEKDFEKWSHRLRFYGLDMRDLVRFVPILAFLCVPTDTADSLSQSPEWRRSAGGCTRTSTTWT